jgi:hypothetical protein
MERCRLRTAVSRTDSNQQVVRSGFCILHLNIEVAIAVKSAGVGKFKFRLGGPTAPILFR